MFKIETLIISDIMKTLIHTFGARNDNQNINDYFYKFYDDVFFPTLVETGNYCLCSYG
jgi:hypothetical protein